MNTIKMYEDEWAKLTKEQQDYYVAKFKEIENWEPEKDEGGMRWNHTSFDRFDYVDEAGEIHATITQGYREWNFRKRRFVTQEAAMKAVEIEFETARKIFEV